MLRAASNNNGNQGPFFETIPVTKFASLSESDWVIDEILPQAELAVIFGEPGCGKTFLALDMAMSVARGIEWHDKTTAKGRIVYICAEGANGFKKRTLAYLIHHRIDLSLNLDFDVISDAPDFLADFDAPKVSHSILKGGKASVIIIDTFSRVMAGGNENSGEDMGQAILQCKILHKLTGAVIVLIHHSGKDVTRGARGWSGLLGACDTEIEISKLPSGRKAKVTKQKDGETGLEWGFKLNVIELGANKHGKMITSCVYEAMDEIPLAEKKNKIPGKNEKIALDVFKSFNAYAVPMDDMIEECVKSMGYDSSKEDRRRDLSIQAIQSLQKNGLFKIYDNLVHKS